MSNSSGSSFGASGGVAAAPSMSASAIVAKAASGSHVLKIDGYSRTKGLGAGKFITSRSFEIGGHRWCVQYYPDGYSAGFGGSISILISLDPSEAGEVRAQYKISLLDKFGRPVPAHVRESDECVTFSRGSAYGAYRFISKAEMQNPLYLNDDAFCVRCDIGVDKGIVTEDLMIPSVERGVKKETHVRRGV